MSNGGNVLNEARRLIDSGKMTTAQGMPIIMALLADMTVMLVEVSEITKDVPALVKDIQKNSDDIEEHRNEIVNIKINNKRWGVFSSFLTAIGTTLAAWIGTKS